MKDVVIMESRMDKYYRENNSSMQRSSKNRSLYNSVYQDYDNLENLPIPDNTNEIDIPELKKIMNHQTEDELSKTREMKYSNLEEQITRERENSENKIHDINKLLEYAKNENNKLKEQNRPHDHDNYKLLHTLENKSLIEEVREEEIKEPLPDYEPSPSPSELKYQTKKISINPSIDQIIPNDNTAMSSTTSLSLDILSDLKPTENSDTGITKPINENTVEALPPTDEVNVIKDDLEQEETEDTTFYTDTYKFSKKDFDKDFYDTEPKNHYVLKVLLLILFIVACAVAIFYFISKYGLNK